MTPKQLEEFTFNYEAINKLKMETHSAFMKYSELQLKLDRLQAEQNILFNKIIEDKPNA